MANNLQRLKELLQAELLQTRDIKSDLRFNSLQFDSRFVGRHDVFFAIKGFEADGHKYLEKACQQGALAVVVTYWPSELDLANFPAYVFKVANSRKALAIAANYFYDEPSKALNLVGITASNGKTSTSLFYKSIVKAANENCGLVGTVSYETSKREEMSHLTTPDALKLQSLLAEMRDSNYKHAVMECSSIGLDQYRNYAVQYQAVAFNNISREHLDYHGSFADYLEAKLKLLTECASEQTIVVLNFDDQVIYDKRHLAKGKVIGFADFSNWADKLVNLQLADCPKVLAKAIDLSKGTASFNLLVNKELVEKTLFKEEFVKKELVSEVLQKKTLEKEAASASATLEAELAVSPQTASIQTASIQTASQQLASQQLAQAYISVPVNLKVPGYHSVMNALAAASLGLATGFSLAKIVKGLEAYTGIERRFQRILAATSLAFNSPWRAYVNYQIYDDHFANPGNIRFTLNSLCKMQYANLHIVYAIRGKRGVTVNSENIQTLKDYLPNLRLANFIATTSNDVVGHYDTVTEAELAAFQKEMAELGKEYMLYPTLEGALQCALEKVQTGDVILLAGCQGMDAGARLCLEMLQAKHPNLDASEIMAVVKDRICGQADEALNKDKLFAGA